MIAVDGLQRKFGDFALGPVSLVAEKGDYWVVLGPSGSGKSMLLHTIAGIFMPDRGRVKIDDADATKLVPEKRNIGLVFQQSALFPHMSVLENIEYGLKVRGMSPSERKARTDELIPSLKVESLIDRPVATLSGGEAQKIAIARALAIRPKVLLLDEPLGPIDHNARMELQSELRRIHAEFELTTLHITHSREEARALGDHCAVMFNGRLIQHGPTEQVFTSPRCPFVARFLGSEEAAPSELPGCTEDCLAEPGHCTAPEA